MEVELGIPILRNIIELTSMSSKLVLDEIIDPKRCSLFL